MRKIVLASAALAGGLLMAVLVWSSAQATTSLPNPQSALGTGGDLVFVGRGGGRGGRGGLSRGGGGFKGAYRGGGGRAKHAYRGGGGRYDGGNRYYGKRYYGNRYGYRRYGYRPWIGVGAYRYGSTNCDWLYRHNYRRWLAVCQ